MMIGLPEIPQPRGLQLSLLDHPVVVKALDPVWAFLPLYMA
jgi:hypothetical protein